MQHLNFAKPITSSSHLQEINTLTRSIDEARQAILRFVTLSSALAQASDLDQLIANLMREVMTAAHLHSGMLYLLDKDNAKAIPQFSSHDGVDFVAPEIHLAVDVDSVLSMTLLHGKRTLRQLQECYPSDLVILGDKAELLGDSGMLVGIPLKDNAGGILGAIMLMGRFSEEGESAQLLSFLEALSSNAATAIKNRQLIQEQKALFEAMIDLIAGAIDAKSRYTGEHCQRVPVLTRMLAEAACRQTVGPFSHFSLSKEQWWELHVASGLHDCGKITTPEFVVDKATKLETIYDRIHEIRMRFEVLKRDREISALRVRAGSPSNEEQAQLEAQLRQLDEDFYFVADCNTGSELMAPEKLERIRRIAAYPWSRTLDDRIGISHEELERKSRMPAPALPVFEQVLEDKLEHLFLRSPKERLAPDNAWGFKVNVPEYLYNRGELYNLSISRGTLTPEERYKINEHILQTIMMLEKLPLPEQLSNVPEIAGGHHEKMDGTGYPRRLMGMEMSTVARIMAIADIFEAITAVDRPYKKGKKLSETVAIMQKMADEGHIDPQLFALFLQEGVHLQYAAQFMATEQIDL
nr:MULTISPECIES: HD domain-containing phosphohydrolase [unclassified Herbaspirillum]